jgi:O-acetylserine/cysteine efflux transporter
MTPLHLLMAIVVTAIWGTNFVVIKWGLSVFPPLLFATLRFASSAFPWIFFVPKPPLPWRFFVAFGILLGAGQFGLLFIALRHDILPGIASLIMQTQVLFTIALSWLILHERITFKQVGALLLATSGIALIGWRTIEGSDATITGTGFLLVLGAAVAWSLANQVAKLAGRVNMLGFMVWSSLFSVPALLLLSLVFEDWRRVPAILEAASLTAWAAVAWQAIGNTLIGFGVWNWLMTRYAAATVSPLALLIPVFGMSSSALITGESLPAWKLAAAGLVIGGLALNVLATRAANRP